MVHRIVLQTSACVTLCSCSFHLSHGDGSATYFGVVNLREGNAGDAPFVHSRRFGVMLDAGPGAAGAAVGYDEQLIVRPPNDATTTLDYTPGLGDPDLRIQPASEPSPIREAEGDVVTFKGHRRGPESGAGS